MAEPRHAVARWLALLDAARAAQTARRADDPVSVRQASRLAYSWLAFEHTMLPEERRTARETLWRRDHIAQPFPDATTRQGWTACHCLSCWATQQQSSYPRRLVRKE